MCISPETPDRWTADKQPFAAAVAADWRWFPRESGPVPERQGWALRWVWRFGAMFRAFETRPEWESGHCGRGPRGI